jgi:hypothetical protein
MNLNKIEEIGRQKLALTSCGENPANIIIMKLPQLLKSPMLSGFSLVRPKGIEEFE